MIFFVLSLLPILVWAIQWYFNRQVVWKEAAVGAAMALLTATTFQVIESAGVFIPSDTETWSGRVVYAQHQPAWVEYYEYAVYRTEYYTTTDSKGHTTVHTRQVFDHWQPTSRLHPDSWWTETELGEFDTNQVRYADILKEFGGNAAPVRGVRTTGEHNSRLLSGPYDDNRTVNVTGYVYPVEDDRKFENRLLKAKDSLYSFEPVTPEQAKRLFGWPNTENRYDSDRLLGTAKELWNRREWDQMNAVLGPEKNVNLIAVGFPKGSALELGMLQQHYWHGGKKNDLVITFGGDPKKPEWAYVFGWTEDELVKRLLENRLRSGEATIDEISSIVRANYRLLAFEEKFSNIEISPPWWYYLIFGVVMVLSQGIAHFVFSTNEEEKL